VGRSPFEILGAPLQEKACFSVLTLNIFAESFGDEVESELQGKWTKCVGARAS